MAIDTVVFPCSFDARLRADPNGLLRQELVKTGQTREDRELRDMCRMALVTQTEAEADAYADDVLARLRPNWEVNVFMLIGHEGLWDYEAWLVSSGVISEMIASDHLCRIVTRLHQSNLSVHVNKWPPKWPRLRWGWLTYVAEPDRRRSA